MGEWSDTYVAPGLQEEKCADRKNRICRDGKSGLPRIIAMALIKRTLTRAAALLTAGALSLWAGFAQAHDGAHAPRALARVDAAVVEGNTVSFALKVTGVEPVHGLAVEGLAAQGAIPARRAAPVPVPFAQDVVIYSRLQFDMPPPDIFVLIVDFGAARAGGVTIIPKPAALKA